MASHQFLCSHQLYASYNSKTQFNYFKKGTFRLPSSFKPHGLIVLGQKIATLEDPFDQSHDWQKTSVEAVYDLEDKLNKLADEVDEDAGTSRLTLFSPCKE